MFEVYDVNDKLTIARFRSIKDAIQCARDMNEGKLDKLYEVRPARKR